MNIIKNEIKIGLEKPFRAVHISDNHLTYADETDDPRKRELARERIKGFPKNSEILAEELEYAKRNGLTVLHTGDMIDFVSNANIAAAKQISAQNDLFFAAGNHEFSLYVGEAFEDEAYRNQSLDKIQALFGNNIRFAVRKMGGINFVAIDNSYYRYEEWQYEAFKEVLKQDMPIVILQHNPLYEENLYNIAIGKASSAYLVSVPEKLMQGYPEDRYIQQKADDITIKMTELIKSSDAVKAVICGHLHYDYEGFLTDRLKQYVSGLGTLRDISFI